MANENPLTKADWCANIFEIWTIKWQQNWAIGIYTFLPWTRGSCLTACFSIIDNKTFTYVLTHCAKSTNDYGVIGITPPVQFRVQFRWCPKSCLGRRNPPLRHGCDNDSSKKDKFAICFLMAGETGLHFNPEKSWAGLLKLFSSVKFTPPIELWLCREQLFHWSETLTWHVTYSEASPSSSERKTGLPPWIAIVIHYTRMVSW